jgi:hypothetical protein
MREAVEVAKHGMSNITQTVDCVKYNIVTDKINALPGSGSVNTVQHATIGEAVFSMFTVTSHIR